MKKVLKNQAGVAIIAIILVVVLAVVGGGAAFLAVRMVVSGDGNFLQPFEELGWIDPQDDDSDDEDKEDKKSDDKNKKDDKDEDEDKKKEDDKKSKDKKKVTSKTDYLVEESRLSSEAKKADVEHYYGAISLADEIDENDEYADLYKLMKAGINLYAKDGKAVEIAFGFDISEFCKKAYEEYKDDFEDIEVNSAEDLEEMMMSMIESMFDEFDEEYSDYITKYVNGGIFQLYVTEKGFESLYETYDIKDDEDDVEVLIDALEDAFNTKIKLVED